MNKIKATFLLIFLFMVFSAETGFALSARSAIVMDAVSGRILFSHNAEERAGMASTTKIMTAITALENSELSSVVTASSAASSVEGSSMYLTSGEKLTLEDVLYGLMLVSGNDAATAVAEHVSGSVEKFAELMNRKALEIGAYNTNFTNPHGLSDKNHYTTAHDLALITAYGMKNPGFVKIVSTKTKKIPWQNHDYDRVLVNHNKFMSMYDGCIGVKTGFTKATGRCLVTAVDKNNMRLICVTLNAPDDWNDHKQLYDTVFSDYMPYKLKNKDEVVITGELKKGTAKNINLVCTEDVYIPIKDGEDKNIELVPEVFEDLQAPINKGDVLGKLKVNINGKGCGEFPLCAAENVALKKIIFKQIKNDWSTALKKVFYLWLTSMI